MWTDLLYRLRAILLRRQMDHDLDEELRFHMEHQIQQQGRGRARQRTLDGFKVVVDCGSGVAGRASSR